VPGKLSAIPDEIAHEVRAFIVTHLACYETPTAVAKAVKEAYDIVLNRSTIAHYHPESTGARLAPEWVDLFHEMRATFKARMREVPIADRAYRMWRLQQILDREDDRGNLAGARDALEQAAKEEGGAFTNKRELTGENGAPIATELTVRFVRPAEPAIAPAMTGVPAAITDGTADAAADASR
jgi:hypothetical protein